MVFEVYVIEQTNTDIMIATREEIIELRYKVASVLRKAQCRAVNCDIIDSLYHIEKELADLDNEMTEIIGD